MYEYVNTIILMTISWFFLNLISINLDIFNFVTMVSAACEANSKIDLNSVLSILQQREDQKDVEYASLVEIFSLDEHVAVLWREVVLSSALVKWQKIQKSSVSYLIFWYL